MADSENPNAPVFLQQFSGLVNTRTEERLGPDELLLAKNIDLDDVKQVHRRRGQILKDGSRWHSLITASNGNVYGVRDGNFCRIPTDYVTGEALLEGVGIEKLAYVEVDKVIYANSRSTSFKLSTITDVVTPWGGLDGSGQWWSPVLQPTETLGEVAGKLLRNPPRAEFMTYYNGRVYMGLDGVIWATELYQYDYVDATRTYMPVEGKVSGLQAVTDGIFVGTEKGCYFCRGSFGEMRMTKVLPEAVVPGSMILGNPADFPDNRGQTQSCALFLTSGGLCVGFDGGVCKNLTSEKFWFPNAVSASAVNRSQDGISQYIGVVDSGGSPASGTRIGDYVDAEIRRFNGA